MDDKTKKDVTDLLASVEKINGVRIIHAVESGSRAWGFPSTDSDYDVRYIYLRPAAWYLSVFENKDNIPPVFLGELDAVGWDVLKVLRLLSKGNAAVYEWLKSPVVYRTEKSDHKMLLDFADRVFNPLPAFHHYRSMAKKKLLEAKVGMNAKSFLYGLRAVFCAKWIAEDLSAPPVAFDILVERYLKGEVLRSELEALLSEKSTSLEAECEMASAHLLRFACDECLALEKLEVEASDKPEKKDFDIVFQSLLRVA